ncbi:MAG: hypothetical protein CM1200mP27_13450 [Chloroflexota bacterium]|nr:MAG: hypothetical protein CM1200mP27_13450 [Chloroflexota bacterium]
MEQAQFDSWAADYGPPPTNTARAKKGQQVFAANCTLCHNIDGPDDPSLAKSRLEGFLTGGDITPVPAPNLTDLRTRETLAAGIMTFQRRLYETGYMTQKTSNPATICPSVQSYIKMAQRT